MATRAQSTKSSVKSTSNKSRWLKPQFIVIAAVVLLAAVGTAILSASNAATPLDTSGTKFVNRSVLVGDKYVHRFYNQRTNKRLTIPDGAYGVSFTKDGKKAAYVYNKGIYILADTSGTAAGTLLRGSLDFPLSYEITAWSPTGTDIAFNGCTDVKVSPNNGSIPCANQVFKINTSSKVITKVSKHDARFFATSLSWSSKNVIAYTSFGVPTVNSGSITESSLLTIKADGTSPTTLLKGIGTTADPGKFTYYTGASWSPDGTKIVYSAGNIHFTFGKGGPGQNALWTMNADGTSKVNIINNPHYDIKKGFWSPNGQTLAFEARVPNTPFVGYEENHGTFVFSLSTPGLLNESLLDGNAADIIAWTL